MAEFPSSGESPERRRTTLAGRLVLGGMLAWAAVFFGLLAHGLVTMSDPAERRLLKPWLDGWLAVGSLAMCFLLVWALWSARSKPDRGRRTGVGTKIIVALVALMFAWYAWDFARIALNP